MADMNHTNKKTPLRHLNRLCAVQLLYMWDSNRPDSLEAALVNFFKFQEYERAAFEFAEELFVGCLEQIEAVDEIIKKYSQNWKFDRISKVDLAILRLAVYELLYRNDIPPIVSINEAIDLAKELSSPDSKRFVNGVLDKVKLTLKRPLRSSAGSETKDNTLEEKEAEEEEE